MAGELGDVLAEIQKSNASLEVIADGIRGQGSILGKIGESMAIVLERTRAENGTGLDALAARSPRGVSLSNLLTIVSALVLIGGFLFINIHADIRDVETADAATSEAEIAWRVQHDRDSIPLNTSQTWAIAANARTLEIVWARVFPDIPYSGPLALPPAIGPGRLAE